MKKQFLNFLLFFLFIFFLFVLSTRGKAVVEDINGGGASQCDYYGTINPCNTWFEYGCPEENYYGVGDIPEENILYGSNVYQGTVTQTCDVGDTLCSQGTIRRYDWVPDIKNPSGCNNNEYCDKNDEGDFFCHLADECNPENFTGSFPEEPLSPKNNAGDVLIPAGLDWCDMPSFYSYKIKLYKVETKTEKVLVFDEDLNKVWIDVEVEVDVFQEEMITNNSHYCLKGLEKDTAYKWQIAYCRGENGNSCEVFQQKWKFITGEERDVTPPSYFGLSPSFGSTNNSLPLTLEWDSVSDEKSYYVEIYNIGGYANGERPIWFQSTTDTKIEGIYLTPNSEYEWRIASCAEGNGTACGDDCCNNVSGMECGDFSNLLGVYLLPFATNNDITYLRAILTNPVYYKDETGEHIPSVGPHNQLQWKTNLGGVAYRCDINGPDSSLIFFIKENFVDLDLDLNSDRIYIDPELNKTGTIWENLNSNEVHSWTITPCSRATSDCQIVAKSEKWYFKTSGGATETLYPSIGESNIPSDITFRWSKVPEAFSYIYEISSPSGIATGTSSFNSTFFSYPEESIGKNFFWRVKACDGMNGTYCRDDWHRADFTIANFVIPSNPYPADEGNFFTYENYISWEPILLAKTYKYTLQYDRKAEEEKREECNAGTMIAEDIIIFLNRFTVRDQTKCLGEYKWWVTACFNKDCTGETRTSPYWVFNSIKSEGSVGGILPCNRIADNMNTPWDETESCQIKHVPIFFYNVLDFILWKASLIAFLFLIIASGVYSYAAAGLPVKVVSLKDIWAAAGKGYSIMFLAWTMISLILKVLGISSTWLILPF